MATQAQIDAATAGVVEGLQLAGSIAGVVDPSIKPLIVIGNAAAAAIPGLVDDVLALINSQQAGSDPTLAQNAALAAKIAALGNPASL